MFSLPKEAPSPPSGEDLRIARRFRTQGLWLAVLCIVTAALTLVSGWVFGVPFLIRFFEGYPTMVPEAALCVLIGGIGAVLS